MTSSDVHAEADAVYAALLARTGEEAPQPRLSATRRVLEYLGDPHRAHPMIHLTGTNGKTSTARMVESLLRAHGLRTGLFTSPHLVRFTERIMIAGEPISDADVVANWRDIEPYVALTDAELEEAGEPRLTYFELLTVLAYASFADAPVDVAVVEVGMGGEWDSTNVADGDVAVFAPISLDHTKRLGSTIAEIAATKAGIIKPAAAVVSAAQQPEARAELERASQLSDATLLSEPDAFGLESTTVAVGGQLIDVRGAAGTYRDILVPLYGEHQAHNAALAIAAVEQFLGRGSQPLQSDVVLEAFADVTSPGRLHIVGTEPTVIVDAAHNPAGAAALAHALRTYFDFEKIAFVVGILEDKDAHGIVDELAPLAETITVTRSSSARSREVDDLTEQTRGWVDQVVTGVDDVETAVDEARRWAADGPGRAVIVTGSITLVGDVIAYAYEQEWK